MALVLKVMVQRLFLITSKAVMEKIRYSGKIYGKIGKGPHTRYFDTGLHTNYIEALEKQLKEVVEINKELEKKLKDENTLR